MKPLVLVLVIRKENNQLAISASYIESNIRVYLSVKSKDITSAEITARLGFKPTKTIYSKRQYHNWQFEPQPDYPEELERKLDYLLDCLMPNQDNIALLSSQASIYQYCI